MEGNIFGFKKPEKNSEDAHPAEFVAPEDKKIITKIAAEEVELEKDYQEKVKKLDRKITAIQQSTKTSLPVLQRFHNKMRMRYGWYYKWHLNPMANTLHWGIFSLYLVFLCSFLALGVFSGPYKQVKAATDCNWTNGNATGIWNDALNWSCGNIPTTTNNVVLNDIFSSDDLNIDAVASVAAFTTTGYNGTITVSAASLTVAGPMEVGISTTINGPSKILTISDTNLNAGLMVRGSCNFTTNNLTGNVTIQSGATFSGGVTFNGGSDASTQYYNDYTASLQGLGTVVINPNAMFRLASSFGMKASSVSMSPSGGGSFNISGATLVLTGGGSPLALYRPFTVTGSTVRYTSGGATNIGNITTAASTTFNNLELKPTSAATYTLAAAASKTITCTGSLTIGDGSIAVTVNHETRDPALNISGNMTVATNAIFTKSSTATITFNGTVAATLTDNTAGQNYGKVTLTGTVDKTLNLAGTAAGISFSTFTISASPDNYHTLNIGNKNFTVTSLVNTSQGLVTTSGDGSNLTIPTASIGKFTFTNAASALPSKTYSTLTLTAGGTSSGTVTVSTNLALTETFDIAGNTLSAAAVSGSGTILTSGDGSNLAFASNAGKVSFTNAASALPSKTYTTLTLGNGGASSGAVTATTLNLNGGELILNNSLGVINITIIGGATLTAGGNGINVSGNWSNAGNFSSSGTVTFNGSSGQNITSGGSAFNNIDITNVSANGVSFLDPLIIGGTLKNNTATATMKFKEGSLHTIHTLDFKGADGVANSVKLRSTSDSQQWQLTHTDITNADYLDIQDADNTGSLIVTTHSKDSGNNNNIYLTNSYETSTNTPQVAGVGWTEILTAKDYYSNTVTSDSATVVTMTSDSATTKFYTDATYTVETTTYTLVNGVVTIYIKDNNPATETITYTITDSQATAVTSGNITVTNNPPVSTITTPADSATVGAGTVQIQGTASDPDGGTITQVEISVDSGAWELATGTGNWTYDTSITAGGSHNIKSRATDNTGAVETPGAGITINVSADKPSVQITKPSPNEWVKDDTYEVTGKTVNLSGSPISKVEITFDGSIWKEATSTDNFANWKYVLTNVPDGRYTLQAKATNNIGDVSASYSVSFGFDRIAPNVPADIKAFDVSDRISGQNRAFVYWSVSTDATSGLKEYQIWRDGSQIATTTDNYYVDEGLLSQTYTYKVKAVDFAGNSSESSESKVSLVAPSNYKTTLSEVSAKVSKIADASGTSALITWKTDNPATSMVWYGLGGAKAQSAGFNNKLNMGHSVVLSNLKPSTVYHFSVVSKDIYGNEVRSGDQTFITPSVEKETVWRIIEKTLGRSFEWLNKVLARPVLEKLGLIKSPEQVVPNMLVFDVSIPEISKYQTLVTTSQMSNFTLERSTDGVNFGFLASVKDKNYYLDQDVSAEKTYYYRASGISGMVVVRPAGIDNSPPVISDVTFKELAVNSSSADVVITWQTDKLSSSILNIANQVKKDDFLNQSHTMVVTLTPGKSYPYQIEAASSDGIAAEPVSKTLSISAPEKEPTLLRIIYQAVQKDINKFVNWMKK